MVRDPGGWEGAPFCSPVGGLGSSQRGRKKSFKFVFVDIGFIEFTLTQQKQRTHDNAAALCRH